eukprot:SAG22_NODE_572_length_9005_cov_105.428138_4_plen_133_part_00
MALPHPLVHSRLPPQRRKPHQLPFLDADVKPDYKQPPRSVLHHRTPKSNRTAGGRDGRLTGGPAAGGEVPVAPSPSTCATRSCSSCTRARPALTGAAHLIYKAFDQRMDRNRQLELADRQAAQSRYLCSPPG